MDIEEFLLEMADSDECRKINYKRLAIREYIGIYYAQKLVPGEIDSFMIPFKMCIRDRYTVSASSSISGLNSLPEVSVGYTSLNLFSES